MIDLVTFGETMLRLSPPSYEKLEDSPELRVHVGGAESNVAINVARLGLKTAWFSRLPQNPLGHTVRNYMRHHGVHTDHIIWTDERLGLYFAEFGAAPHGVRVWYDRAHSAASHMTPDDLPLDFIAEAKWLHVTGITPALSASCAETTSVALAHARNSGTTISFDVNYRSRLWSAEQAASILAPLCEAADVVLVAHRDAVELWHCADDVSQCAVELQERWGGIIIVSTGADGVVASNGNSVIEVPAIPATVVDRMGAGDALASGVIYKLLQKDSLDSALKFGVAMAALALSVPGDIAYVDHTDVERCLQQGHLQQPLR